MKYEVINEVVEGRGMGRISREEWRNSRTAKELVLSLTSPAGFAPRPGVGGGGGAARCPPCSQNAHDEGGGMTPVPIPCSRSAHDQNVLARRPQWDQHRCHSMRGAAS